MKQYFFCGPCQCTYSCEELRKLVPHGCKFGFDILVYVGESMFLQYRSEKEIKAELPAKNIDISLREIGILSKCFLIYLTLAHKEIKPQIRSECWSKLTPTYENYEDYENNHSL